MRVCFRTAVLLVAPVGSVVCVVSCVSGCVIAVSGSGAVGLDTAAAPSTEGRVDLESAVGDESIRMDTRLGLGGGYYGEGDGRSHGTGFFTVTPHLGLSGGRDLHWSVGAMWVARVGTDPSGNTVVHSGVGGASP